MENTLVAQSQPATEIYNQAADLLLRQQQSPEATVQTLIARGISTEIANDVVADLHAQIIAAKKKQAEKDMLYGALWCIGGTIATLAQIGFIFWGAIVFGGIQFFKGLMNYSGGK